MKTIQWCDWLDIINEHFEPLIENKDRYLILWGGRGSSKSDFTAKKLIYRCLSEPYFRYILYRKQYNTIKGSQYDTIKDIIHDLGLDQFFDFTINPLEIRCKNGNKFFCRGGDDPKTLKSVKDPTGVWYEEEIPTEGDFITITTSIRTSKTPYLQEVFTINPEVEGDFNEHWFFKRFFAGNYPGPKQVNGTTSIKLESEVKINLNYTTHHSTYRDNRWIPNEFIAMLEDLGIRNPYYYTVYCLGQWGNKVTGGLFYKEFKRGVHTGSAKYNSSLPLHFSFDFNTKPYNTCIISQLSNKSVYFIGEICLKSPNNSTGHVARAALDYCNKVGHKNTIYIYGDPSGKAANTTSEEGYNQFDIILKEMWSLRPVKRVQEKAPFVAVRGQFINEVLRDKYAGISIVIDEKCTNLINDLQFLQEDSDGGKFKEMVKDEQDNKVRYQKYGHCSDAMDYLLTKAFESDYNKFQNIPGTVKYSFGRREEREDHQY